ncbi:MAG: VOC family protein [Jatrophihabitans sp.]|uniref:VOC family protein n=1 Tax=Jatrophihabitans sp. TaxID=1932789 RepID=UPI003F7E9EAD
MLSDTTATTILMVRDGERAVEFYRDRLGLKYEGRQATDEELFSLRAGGLALRVDPTATASGRTEMSFEVDDIVGEIKELESRGVSFQDYDLPGLTTVDHIAERDGQKAAWFLDPDGNVLCLHQLPS